MRPVQHIYMTAHGQYVSGAWVGEAAQWGLRLTIAETGAMPDKGSLFTIPLNGDAVTDQGATAGTHGTLYRTWSARRGPSSSNENMDAGFQIDLAEDVWKFLNALAGYFHNSFRWTSVKIMPVAADGKVCTDQDGQRLSSSVYTFTTPLAGTANSALPPQLAIAISLRAPVLGRRGRGRIYLGGLATTNLDSTGIIQAVSTTAERAAFVTLVNDLQQLPGTPDYLPLVSIMSPGNSTAYRPLEVRTGQRFDTIRSRREQVAETYTTTAL